MQGPSLTGGSQCTAVRRAVHADMKQQVLVLVVAVAVVAAASEDVTEAPESAGLDFASNRLRHPHQLFRKTAAGALEPAPACGLSYSGALALARRAWDDLLLILGDRVELLGFEDTVMQHYKHPSLRRTVRPLHLVEGTEVTGLRSGEVALVAVNDTEPAVYFTVKLQPLKIRGSLRTGDNAHLLRALLVDMTLRFRTVVDSGDLARLDAPPHEGSGPKRDVAATRYGLARAGHVTHLQVANGDRTETAFGQEIEALLGGAAVTSVWFEVQRAASVHMNWSRERSKALHWDPIQHPRSWDPPTPAPAK